MRVEDNQKSGSLTVSLKDLDNRTLREAVNVF